MVYFDSNYLHVEYYAASNVLISQWYGGCSSLQYRQALIKGIRLTKELGVEYAIMDERLIPPLSNEDFNWTRDFYMRALHRLPLKRVALVNAFDAAAEDQLLQMYHPQNGSLPFETCTFDDLTSAYEWLTSNAE